MKKVNIFMHMPKNSNSLLKQQSYQQLHYQTYIIKPTLSNLQQINCFLINSDLSFVLNSKI